jgi:hypothetical protein
MARNGRHSDRQDRLGGWARLATDGGKARQADIVKQVVEGWPGRAAAKAGGQDNADWQAFQEKKAGINREKGVGR